MRVPMNQIKVWPILKQTAGEWSEDKASKMAASLAYYTATSIAPLAVAIVGIGTLVLRNKFDPGALKDKLSDLTTPAVGSTLAEIINKPNAGHAGLIATILGITIALFSASGVFGELQDSLNTIWEVKPKPNRGVKGIIHDRFLTLSMVLGVAFLLLVSTVLTTVVGATSNAVVGRFTGGAISSTVASTILEIIIFAMNTAVITVLFAAMFKLLPDVIIKWRDVWLGAFLTALLFQIGKLGMSKYFEYASPGSAFGAAGTIVVLLVWVYYSAQILFFGAEFTQVYANQYGSHVVPAENAEPLTEEMRQQAGIAHAPDSPSHPDNLRPPVKPRPKPAPRFTPSMAGQSVVLTAVPVAVGVVLGRLAYRRYLAVDTNRHLTAAITETLAQTAMLVPAEAKATAAPRPTESVDAVAGGWRKAGHKWKRLGQLFVSNARQRYAITHGPIGRRGPKWADLAEKVTGA